MMPINNIRSVDIVIQRQYINPAAIVLRFIGLKTLHLAPKSDKYTCEIFDAAVLFKNSYIFWTDDANVTKENIENYGRTWACGDKLQWRIIDECIGNGEVFQGKYEND